MSEEICSKCGFPYQRNLGFAAKCTGCGTYQQLGPADRSQSNGVWRPTPVKKITVKKPRRVVNATLYE